MIVSKRIITILFSVILITMFAGCSSSSDSGNKKSQEGSDDANTSEGLEEVKVSIGWQPHGGPNAVQALYIAENELVEKQAEKLGMDLTIDWKSYQSGAPMLTELIAGELDIGLEGSTPVVRSIAEKQPLDIISMGEGRFNFVLLTRKGSGIRNFEDLKGKKLGVILATDNEFAFRDMINASLGSNDPSDFDIKLVNMSTQAQAASIPGGIDAAVTTYPNFVKAQLQDPDIVAVANSLGESEEHYEGEAGTGAGLKIPTVNESNMPEGFYLHRAFWVAQDELVQNKPDLIKAFLLAQQQATVELAEKPFDESAEMVAGEQYWGIPAEYGEKIIEDDILFIRNWIWITEGELNALNSLTNSLATAKPDSEVPTKEQLMENLKKSADILKDVYNETGYPDEEEFHDDDSIDIRGYPSWEMDKWEN